MQQKTFAVACKDFFGYLPGQGFSQFAAELKALTAQDKAELCAMFPSVGIEIISGATVPKAA